MGPRFAFARREVLLVAGAVGLVLLVFSGRYGYHRDELYFLEAGRHLAWGYPDQPPLVPLLARAANWLDPGSLLVLRLPATCAMAVVVALTGLMARDLGAARAGQVLAAAATAVSGVVLAAGHLLSTTSIAMLGWVVITYLLVRLLADGPTWSLWIALGSVGGLTVQTNPLVIAFLATVFIGVLVAGPRNVFKSLGPYVAAALTLTVAMPYLIWQTAHGWPQLEVARSISAGGSGTSTSRVAFLPLQLLVVGPWLTPIWIAGLVHLWRDSRLQAIALAYLALVLVFLVVGGKDYYLAGLYPVLIAAGAQPVVNRIKVWCAALVVLSLPVVVFALPVLPVQDAGWVVKFNYDAGETIGWPHLVAQVAAIYHKLPRGTQILTENYGQAGAIDRYGPQWNLPEPYSGHMAYAEWGPPPPATTSVLAVGISPQLLHRIFTSVQLVGTLRNPWGIKNQEYGTVLYYCESPALAWSQAWPLLQHY